MRERRQARGLSLVELLVAVSILLILMIAVGDAVMHALRAQSRHAGRVSSNRSASELMARLREEARSSTAVFVPAVDVTGNSNDGGHEVDFFRKSSAGADTFVAYLFDAGAGTVARDEYATANGVRTILHSDEVAAGVATFAASRASAASFNDVVNSGAVQQVSIQYGHPQVTGGNDVITVALGISVGPGLPPQMMEIHIAAKAAPTSLAIVVPAGAPPTNPPMQTIPFVIVGRRPVTQPPRFPLPHGPINPQDPGQGDSLLVGGNPERPTTPTINGTATYVGDGTGLNWLDVLSLDPTLTDGTFIFMSAGGSRITLTISCGSRACPPFVPLPVADLSAAPAGGVVFQVTN